MRVEATQELLSPREDVWSFLAEPHHLSDWWPGIAAVQPDRRGVAPGARWQVRGGSRPGLLRRPGASSTLLIQRVERPELLAWHLTGERLDVELRLTVSRPGRTVATLTVEGPWLVGFSRSLARHALNRLHALCQTAADL